MVRICFIWANNLQWFINLYVKGLALLEQKIEPQILSYHWLQ